MITYSIDSDGNIYDLSDDDRKALMDTFIRHLKVDIDRLCRFAFAKTNNDEQDNRPKTCTITHWDGDDMKPKYRPHLLTPEHPPMDSPAGYRRKMNVSWEDPIACTALLNQSTEEHIDDSSQRNFCKEIKLDDTHTRGMRVYGLIYR